MNFLFILHGNDQGKKYTITQEEITIGRNPDNTIVLHDKESSRRHAAIRQEGDKFTLLDLDSSNGVYLNGEQVSNTPLKNGDQIQIGRTLFLFTQTVSGRESDFQGPAISFPANDNESDQSKIVHSIRHDAADRIFQGRTDEQKRESDWFEKARSYLNLMYHTTLVVSQTLDIDSLLSRIMDLIFDVIHVDRACIFLYNPDENKLVSQVSKVQPGFSKRPETTISRTILDYVLRKNEGVLTSDALTDQRWDSAASIFCHGIREAICVPMQGRYGLVGLIYIDISFQTKEILDQTTKEILDQTTQEVPLAEPPNLLESPPDEISKTGVTKETPSAPPSGKLTLDHLKLMVAVGHQAALAVEDTRYYRSMLQGERLAAVGQTVAVLSHHIKNILQGISGGGYLIEHGLNSHNEDSIRKGWGIVEKNQKKISDLILDMLTFSKERQPFFSENDLNQVLADVVELMQGRCMECDIDLELRMSSELRSFFFDKEQVHRAVTNLVSNAIDAVMLKLNELQEDDEDEQMEQTETDPVLNPTAVRGNAPFRGQVRIQSLVSEQNGQILIIIDDNGPGIPDDLKDTLFRPFFSKNKSGGTGIGLAVTHKIIQEHKGSIVIDNSPFGGARFVVSLPFLSEKPEIVDNENS